MEIPPEGRHHEPERERLRLLQSHRGRRVVKAAQGRDLETKKEEEEKRETETQERELTNSFCPARRHFSILPYPETGFVSGNFCRVFENSRPNPKDCEVPLQRRKKEKKNKKSNPGVLERHWAGLAGREKPTGEEQLANRASFIHFSFFFVCVLLPGVLCFLLPHTTTHRPPESVSFES